MKKKLVFNPISKELHVHYHAALLGFDLVHFGALFQEVDLSFGENVERVARLAFDLSTK